MLKIHNQGFTLIELAVVMLIIGLLMVGLLGPVATQIEARERQQTIDTMNDIMESLYGFAILNGYLPCPDSIGDGISEPPASATCTAANGDGYLPWQTLGIDVQADAWGNRFKYHVTTPGFTTIDDGLCVVGGDGNLDLCEPGDITIMSRGDDTATVGATELKSPITIASGIPAVVISHGKNGLGATTVTGVATVATTAGTDENENDDANTDAVFYSRVFTEGGAGCSDDANEANSLCQFDDIVMWVSPNILINRMIKAEVLP
jgi:prepilin-type N-terminal cleavage/methylation domain-containing protein